MMKHPIVALPDIEVERRVSHLFRESSRGLFCYYYFDDHSVSANKRVKTQRFASEFIALKLVTSKWLEYATIRQRHGRACDPP